MLGCGLLDLKGEEGGGAEESTLPGLAVFT